MGNASIDVPVFHIKKFLRIPYNRINNPLLEDDRVERSSNFAFDIVPRKRWTKMRLFLHVVEYDESGNQPRTVSAVCIITFGRLTST